MSIGAASWPSRSLSTRVKSGSSPVATQSLPRGAAPVALPERRVAAHPPGQQRGAPSPPRQVVDLAERQPARRRVERHRVRPAVLAAGWPTAETASTSPSPRPAGDAGARVAPVGAPGRGAAVRVGRVDLGSAVPPAGPGDRGAVPGEPRVADLPAVRGQPPGAAAVGRGEPDVVFGDEGEQITVNVGKPEVSRRCHAVNPTGGGFSARSQPAAFLRDAQRLGPVAGAGLLDAGGQVVPHRPLRQVQCRRDLGDRGAVLARREDVPLARGQRAGALGQRGGGQLRVDDPLAR